MTFFGYLIFASVFAALFFVLAFRKPLNRAVGAGVVVMHLVVPFVQSSLAAGGKQTLIYIISIIWAFSPR